ncbi:MAG: right-handed parallel beta-helix repeat-containing protein [Candidatus Odinarchaeota archaeon]|nr:right-handed parallel beta-helix repeat-containing protein [Candidatus Odinarchaeota archaeon]
MPHYKRRIFIILLFIFLATSICVIFVNTTQTANKYVIIEYKHKHKSVCTLPANIEIGSITGTSPPSSGDWNISDITVVENETLIINGSIFIENGGVLVLRSSTLYMNLNSDGEYWIEVLNGGNMTMVDSTITAYNPDNNYYIKIYSGSKFCMDRSEVSYAGYTWGFDGDKTGLWINTDNVTISNSILSHNYCGVYTYDDSSNVSVASCNISNNHYGMYTWESSNISVVNCNFSHNYYNVYIYDSNNVSVINGSISNTDKRGMFIQYSDNVSIENCTITNNWVSVYIYDSNVSIYFNSLSGIDYSIYISDKDSVNVTIYLNNILSPVYDAGSSRFDNGTYGNYWGVTGPDSNHDWIIDTPHEIDDDSVDQKPLLYPIEVYLYPNSDFDGDSLTNKNEKIYGTNATNPDTDGDGMPDGWEVSYGLNATDSGDASQDADSDGLTNLQEYQYGTNATNPDTDGDGVLDGTEIAQGSNPLNASSTPFSKSIGGAIPSTITIIATVATVVVVLIIGVLVLKKRLTNKKQTLLTFFTFLKQSYL